MTRTRRLIALSTLVLALATAACGGDDDTAADDAGGGDTPTTARPDPEGTERFDDDRFGITFLYPDDFRLGEVTDVQRTAGGESVASQGIGLDDDNAIFLSRYELAVEVSDANVDDVEVELDGVVDQLAGTDVTGFATEIGGLIGFRYDDIAVSPPANGRSDLIFVFDGNDQYQVNCQSTPANRDRIEEACEMVADSIEAT